MVLFYPGVCTFEPNDRFL